VRQQDSLLHMAHKSTDKSNRKLIEPQWLHTHSHEPNPEPPGTDAAFVLIRPDGIEYRITPKELEELPQTIVPDCSIVSTGHGTSGPFIFSGVRLRDLLLAYLPPQAIWHAVDVISADGFGNRVLAQELAEEHARPILLAMEMDDTPMTRADGLVRLIVPGETDDALRQVKWIGQIRVI
jgi:hypothetical protein